MKGPPFPPRLAGSARAPEGRPLQYLAQRRTQVPVGRSRPRSRTSPSRTQCAFSSSPAAVHRRLARDRAAGVVLGQLGEPGRLVHRVADHGVLAAGWRRPPGPPTPARTRCRRPTSTSPAAVTASQIRRAARSAAPAGSECSAGAPNTHSAASPSNLLTSPPSSSTVSTTTSKKRLSRPRTPPGRCAGPVTSSRRCRRRARRSSAARRPGRPRGQRALRHRGSDVPAEQVAQPLPLPQPGGHLLTPSCSSPISPASSTVTRAS